MIPATYRLVLGTAIALTTSSGPLLAAETAGTGFAPFSQFVSSLGAARADDHVGRAAAAVESATAFEEMRQHLVKLYGGMAVAHSFAGDDQTFDCVPISQQPGVRTQGLKRVATPPPKPPSASLTGGAAPGSRPSRGLTQDTGGRLDAFGNAQRCEPGTIPMRRVTLDEITRFKSLQQFFEKGPGGAGRAHTQGRVTPPSFSGHSYAYTDQIVANYGGWSVLNVWRPYVRTGAGNGGEVFSLSQQWYVGGSGAQTQTAEVGWQNFPAKYGSENSALFIYWTGDNYSRTGCYNLDCAAFVQTNSNWSLGRSFLNYSTFGGTQYEVGLGFYLYQGNWWLGAGNDWVGYYPGSLYAGGQLTKNAQRIEFGGETFGSTSWPPMGSGLFANNGWAHAAYQRTILYRDSTNNLFNPSLTVLQPFPSCYTDTTPTWGGSTWRTYFYFGGSGGTNC